MISNRFDMFNDALDQCHWYLFPIEMQRMFIIVTANTQRPTIIHAFGNAQCTRAANKTVRFGVVIIFFFGFKRKLITFFHSFSIILKGDSGELLLFYDASSNVIWENIHLKVQKLNEKRFKFNAYYFLYHIHDQNHIFSYKNKWIKYLINYKN